MKLNETENLGLPILSDREALHITNQAKSVLLYRQYVSVFTQDDGTYLPDKKLLSINQTKAAAPDEWPSKVLKEAGREMH